MKSLIGKIPHVTTLLTTASFVEATKVTFRSLGGGKIHFFSPFIVYFVFVWKGDCVKVTCTLLEAGHSWNPAI